MHGKHLITIDILTTSRNSDRKIAQSIGIMSRPPSRKRKCIQLRQFRLTSTKVIPIKKTYTGYILNMSQGFKWGSK